MKITSVTYRTNRPTQGSRYIHEHVELAAQVGKGETPAKVLEKLRAKARELLYPELANLRERLYNASPNVAARLHLCTEDKLSALYSEHADSFEGLIRGELSPAVFFQQVDDDL